MKIDPLSQFKIYKLIPWEICGIDIAFTNSALFIFLTVLLVWGGLWLCLKKRAIVPNRAQAAAELLLNFLHNTVTSYLGNDGLKYTPFVFCIFLFILGGNILGLLPYSYTFTSQLVVTGALASTVFIMITIIGLAKHRLGFFKLFMPGGIPIYVAPLLIPVEVISYLSRPVSLAVRLFANMFAGHVMLKIFATFAALLISIPWLSAGVVIPTLINVGLFGFELLVALLQAYVFTVLTCIYLNDVLNLH